MRVFITGASGFIGSAVVDEMVRAGHTVTGLARSEEGAATIARLGGQVHRGDIDNHASVLEAVAASDGVIHCAFNHDFSKYKENSEADRHLIEAMGQVLAGTDRPLVVTSGTGVSAQPGHIRVEDDPFRAPSAVMPRMASDEAADAAAARGVKASIVRLPPAVHNTERLGFVSILIEHARQTGVSAYVGDGQNRWPAVHRQDAAKVFALAFEKAAKGVSYQAVGDEGIPVRQIAELVGQGLGLPVKSMTQEEANAHFGWFGMFAGADLPASSKLTQGWLSWKPVHPGLLEDLQHAAQFKK